MPSVKVKECDFLLDPTFRQFCLKKDNQESLFEDQNWLNKGYVAPRPAHFMPENLCKELISKGYIWLSPENAKLYGDAFKKASVRKEYQSIIPDTTGEEYLYYFKNNIMELIEDSKNEEQYTLLPSEIEKMQKKENKLSRLFNKIFSPFFKESSEKASLPSASLSINNYDSLRESIHVSSTDSLFFPSSDTPNPKVIETDREEL